MDELKKNILEAYKIVSDNEEQPNVEAIWGYLLSLSEVSKDISKQEIIDILNKEQCLYTLNGEVINAPIQGVW